MFKIFRDKAKNGMILVYGSNPFQYSYRIRRNPIIYISKKP